MKALIRAEETPWFRSAGFICPEDPVKAVKYITGLYVCSRSERDDKLILGLVEESGVSCAFGIKVPEFESALLIYRSPGCSVQANSVRCGG